jgi:NAD(P)-dependent dehydrogenase (short-subunit alcohol dehydrogenase family)
MKVENKVIVVTGGGSGIGRALVLDLVNRGARVAAVDLNPATLEETKNLVGEYKERVSLHTLDVSDSTAVAALPEKVVEVFGVVDGLINNAGIIQPFVYVNELERSMIDKVMAVNFSGQVQLTQAFLPYLLERPEAHIVNVSSMGGFFPFAGQTIYGASKAAVKLFTEGLFVELLDTHVKVTVVFPGAIDTNITDNSKVEIKGLTDELKSKFPRVSPQKAAKKIINAMEHNRYQVNIGIDAKAMRFLYGMNPRFASVSMFKLMRLLLMEK